MPDDTDCGLLTLDRLFEQSFTRYRDRIALQFQNSTLTYSQLDTRTATLANVYRSLGIESDDRVGILMKNRPEYVIGNIAAIRAGVIAVPLNSQLDSDDARLLLRKADLHTLVVDDTFLEVVHDVQQATNDLNYVIAVRQDRAPPIGFHDYHQLMERASREPPPVDTAPHDITAIYFSSGTTGEPKGIQHAHRPLVLNTYAHIQELDISHGEQMLLTTPLAHSAEPFARAGLAQGATITLQQTFDSVRVLRTIQDASITWTYLVPTMIASLVADSIADESGVTSLETLAYGAAPIPKPVLERGLDRFGDVFIQFYGLTEVPNLIATLPKDEHDTGDETALRSAGYPTQLVEVSIRDIDEPWADDVGEIAVRSPFSFVGYTSARPSVDADGWFRTGDVGYLDGSGRVHVLDRVDDVIVRDGEPVFSSTVESMLQEHEDIKQIGVIGVPRNGQAADDPDQLVKAVIVPSEGQRIELDDLQEVCRNHLGEALPDSIDLVGQLPETPYGKIDKNALRTPYW